jgi:AcrR family transcriptional regulator
MGEGSNSSRGRAGTRLPRAERRAQLVRSAAAAFLAKGFDGTSVEEVAEHAGVTRLIVYRHFAGKEDLYRAVLGSVTDSLRERFDDGQPGNIVSTLLDVAREQPDAFRLLWRHARHEPLFAAEAEVFRLGAAEYAAGVVGRFVADPTFRRWSASALVEHLHEGICTWLDTGDPARDEEFAVRLRNGARAIVDAWSD